MMKSLLEILDNYKNIKIFNKDIFFIDKFKKNNFIYSNVNKKFQVIDNSPRFWLEIAGITGLCGMVFFLLYFDYSPESIVPILGMFSVAFFRIIPSVLRIVRSAQTINFSDPVMDQLLVSLKNSEKYIPQKDFEFIKFMEKIEFKNLSFNYPNKPTQEDKKNYKDWVQKLKYILPCKYCRINLIKNFKELPLRHCDMKNRETFSKYIYNLHELINKMLGKKKRSYLL